MLGATISSDGKYLAFSNPTGLYVGEINNGETHRVKLPPELEVIPDGWYPDGTNLLASSVADFGRSCNLWRISILGGSPQMLIGDDFGGSVSPDGKYIAFLRDGPDYDDHFGHEVWVMTSSGKDAHPITSELRQRLPDIGQMVRFRRLVPQESRSLI